MSEGRFKEEYRSRSRSRSPFRKNFNERSYDDDFKKRRDRSPNGRRSGSSGSKSRLFVKNIPFESRWMEIKDLFRKEVGDVPFVELFEDASGKFTGCGVVEFKDPETAEKAVDKMNQFKVRGRALNVKLDNGESERWRNPSRHDSDRDFGRDRDGDGFGGNNFRSEPQFNTYGLNPQFLRSLGIQGPLNNKVFISNLDYKVTEKKLEEIFKIAGKLVKVDLNVDTDGKSKGHGTAEYENPLEAVQAISMFNGQRLFARIMNVRMDKFTEDGDALPSKLPAGLHGIGKGLGMNGQPMQFNKNSNPIGSFGFGMGMPGNVGGGIGIGSSNMGMMGANSVGMGMSGSNMVPTLDVGMGMGNSSMMSGGSMMGRSGMDGMSRNSSYSMNSGRSSFRDGFERGNDSFNDSSLSDTVIVGNVCVC